MNKLQIKLERLELLLIEDGYNNSNIVLQTVIDIQKEAINYTRCCKSDSELLPKRLSNEAYTMAKGTDHKTFTRWWDMQV